MAGMPKENAGGPFQDELCRNDRMKCKAEAKTQMYLAERRAFATAMRMAGGWPST